jgi:hypothetical protein
MAKELNSEFMMESYKDSSQNVMHIEGQLFNHMSFFLTLFIGTLTAAIAILQLTKQPNATISVTETMGIFCLPFLFLLLVGQFEVQMIMQLRVRKIKFIENIAKAREYFIKADPELSSYIILPSKLEKTPPYLRVKSEDWYRLLFVISLNTVTLFLFWIGLPSFVSLLFDGILHGILTNPVLGLLFSCLNFIWWVFGLSFCVFVYWYSSYQRVMDYCLLYDRKREAFMGKVTEYDLLEIPVPTSWFKRSLSDWFILLEKQRHKNGKTN